MGEGFLGQPPAAIVQQVSVAIADDGVIQAEWTLPGRIVLQDDFPWLRHVHLQRRAFQGLDQQRVDEKLASRADCDR